MLDRQSEALLQNQRKARGANVEVIYLRKCVKRRFIFVPFEGNVPESEQRKGPRLLAKPLGSLKNL